MLGGLVDVVASLIVPVGAACLIWDHVRRRRDQQRDRAQALAKALGLSYTRLVLGVKAGEAPSPAERELRAQPGGNQLLTGMVKLVPGADRWQIHGQVDGVDVEIAPAASTGTVSTTWFTRLTATITPPLAMDLHIGRASAVDRLAWVSSMQRVPSGSPEFDQRISCHAGDVGALRRLLQRPGLLPALHELFADESATVTVSDDRVVVSIAGFVDDVPRLKQHLRRMAAAARRLAAN